MPKYECLRTRRCSSVPVYPFGTNRTQNIPELTVTRKRSKRFESFSFHRKINVVCFSSIEFHSSVRQHLLHRFKLLFEVMLISVRLEYISVPIDITISRQRRRNEIRIALHVFRFHIVSPWTLKQNNTRKNSNNPNNCVNGTRKTISFNEFRWIFIFFTGGY